ncbi:hypothetical protein [Nitratireductor luteus]|uniref:hypothetical protein n=1 Tax=Nitratireductor luteus TaxID=2976980 RepID=UPI0022402AB9|nr:hypothetical protein [Nitratireductor luteus]
MTLQSANDEITLALGVSTVRLRPSLRAASYLERLHDGFAGLFRRVADFHLGTVRAIIMTAATDRHEASAFLARLDATPLKIVADTIAAPILTLVASFIPAPDDTAKTDPTAKPMPWPEVYRELYRTATGWLGWTPETAWNATPTEINEAFAGHMAKLKAIHGSPEGDGEDKQSAPYTPEQLRQIDAQASDPAFDRGGLRALKAKIARAS